MTTEALMPAAAEPAIASAGAGEIGLPQVIVEAGPQAHGAVPGVLRRKDREREDAGGVRAGRRAILGWCEARGLGLRDVSPLHVAAYIRTHPGSAPTVKQHLAAIRMLGDWLVVSQVLPVNPAAAVRGPKHVVTKGATPVLSPAEARKLLESIGMGALAGLRDRALLSVELYSFARVEALRPAGGYGDGRRDRAHRDLTALGGAPRPGRPVSAEPESTTFCSPAYAAEHALAGPRRPGPPTPAHSI